MNPPALRGLLPPERIGCSIYNCDHGNNSADKETAADRQG
jgi:hypothetical protein